MLTIFKGDSPYDNDQHLQPNWCSTFAIIILGILILGGVAKVLDNVEGLIGNVMISSHVVYGIED